MSLKPFPLFLLEILCPYPPSFNCSGYILDGIYPGDVVEYMCNNGCYLVEGLLTWQCSDDGEWIGENIVCEGRCHRICIWHCFFDR